MRIIYLVTKRLVLKQTCALLQLEFVGDDVRYWVVLVALPLVL